MNKTENILDMKPEHQVAIAIAILAHNRTHFFEETYRTVKKLLEDPEFEQVRFLFGLYND